MIVASLVIGVNGCALVGDAIPPDIARHPPLKKAFEKRFPIGAAVEPRQLGTRAGSLLAWHFNSVTAENAMKPANLQPLEGRFEFTGADAVVDFASRRGMRVRGHTLLWHEETPEWFWRGADGRPASREVVLARLRAHIVAVMSRYRGRVYAWDVVNEAVHPLGPGCLRDTRWLRVVGPDYIEHAFRFAHEADPGARLFLNDFETTEPAKRRCLLELVRDLRARGVPIHGVGHQLHIDLERPTVGDVDETLGLFAALGVENQVTELDMSVAASALPPAERLESQATRYAALFEVFARRPDVTAVSFWGISDAHTWLNAKRTPGNLDQPLLFDAQQAPKSAYFAITREKRVPINPNN
ncbi:MAG: endo-1,4-beta-xylanase [Usitatibacter sp.]